MDTMNLGLYHRKINDGRLEKPMGISVSFNEDAIRFNTQSIVDVPELASRLPAWQVIQQYLKENGPSSVDDIAAGTDRKANTIHKAFSDRKELFVEIQNLDGTQKLWGVAS
jgi:hypothetical protein